MSLKRRDAEVGAPEIDMSSSMCETSPLGAAVAPLVTAALLLLDAVVAAAPDDGV